MQINSERKSIQGFLERDKFRGYLLSFAYRSPVGEVDSQFEIGGISGRRLHFLIIDGWSSLVVWCKT
jgi:hypothetical protein